MATDSETGWCGVCMKRVPLERKGINHVLHLILSVLTVGIWLIIWVLAALVRQPWRCGYCGRTVLIVGENAVARIETMNLSHQYELERKRQRTP